MISSNIEVSVIIPVRNEEEFIEACLNSVLANEYPKDNMEIIIIDGNSEDLTVKLVREYQHKFNNVKLFMNPQKIAPVAMNIGIKNAQGKYIIRLDAHASYDKYYIRNCIDLLKKYDADNVGGCLETRPSSNTLMAKSIALGLANKFGVGNSLFRTISEEREVDTVPFGAFKKEVFEKIGTYNELLVRNQDIELNGRIIKNGGKIILSPKIKCAYYARGNLRGLYNQNYNNGKWNIYTTKIASYALSIRHFIPLFFVLAILVSLIGLIIKPIVGFSIMSITLLPYLFLAFIFAYKVAKSEDNYLYTFTMPLVFLTLHLSYGIGSIVGIISLPIFSKKVKGYNL
ncbi:glycosyltransferase family 2 protein [Bacillus wiedmannii]|uniref:glycosyltransferase family 2 protein n=1 Tax=Bacillus wiedmannii TaxID=1890302 RepID=UPI000BED48D6|nr:glycosyltransferase family 2 protein [Bacillus wiedmannii]PDZ42946.1 glycosyl transferase [Bacillus wiedmannii]